GRRGGDQYGTKTGAAARRRSSRGEEERRLAGRRHRSVRRVQFSGRKSSGAVGLERRSQPAGAQRRSRRVLRLVSSRRLDAAFARAFWFGLAGRRRRIPGTRREG